MDATVKDIMTPDVAAVTRDAPFREIAVALRAHHRTSFPVVDSAGTVLGVVSDADLLDNLGRHLAKSAVATDLMRRPAITVTPDEPADHALRLMYIFRVRELPVVDEAGHLAGIVVRSDVLG
jgi:CBS domain-containing protein